MAIEINAQTTGSPLNSLKTKWYNGEAGIGAIIGIVLVKTLAQRTKVITIKMTIEKMLLELNIFVNI